MNNRLHIGIFGRRNVGKSSVTNALTGQQVAIVSDMPGTTTDPVKKIIELTGIGPVVLVDTAGIDDEGALGAQRVEKSKQVIEQIDIAILVIAHNTFGEFEQNLLAAFRKADVPFMVLHNKADLELATPETIEQINKEYHTTVVDYIATTDLANSKNLSNLKNDEVIRLLKNIAPTTIHHQPALLEGLVKPNDIVLLVAPIDSEAPEGRLILPQVQTIRALLDNHCVAIVLKETEIESFLLVTKLKPSLVITDSQLFGKIDKLIPREVPLTGFSVLLAHHKGNFAAYLKGTPAIDKLKDGDRVLILESCTHHSTCDDIGRVKIPRWLREYTKKNLEFEIVSGLSPLPRTITDYTLVLQCGACMITSKQLHNRLQLFIEAGIPVTNYGMAIAYLQGIYKRAVEIFEK